MDNEDGCCTPKVVWNIDVQGIVGSCGCILLLILIFAGPFVVDIINAIKK